MFRYSIALDVSFSGKKPTLIQTDSQDLPIGARVTITIADPIEINDDAGTLTLPVGSQITGTIVKKQELPNPGDGG